MESRVPKRVQQFLRALEDTERDIAWLRENAVWLLTADGVTAGPDGFPQGGQQEGRGKGDHADPVLATVVARQGVVPYDPIHENAAACMNFVRGMARQAGNAKGVVLKARRVQTVDLRFSNGPVDCLACDRTIMCTAEDPVRSGYCQACSTAWYRWKGIEWEAGRLESDPGATRARFERHRRDQLAEVPQARCGHGCCTNLAPHEHFHQPASCPECIARLGEAS